MRKKYISVAVIIMVLGYFTCITINSLLISGVIYRYNSVKSIYVGESADYCTLKISSTNEKSMRDIFDTMDILSEYGRIEVVQGISENLTNNGQDTTVEFIPTSFKQEVGWIPPILSGRYFCIEDNDNNQLSIVIGKSVSEKLGLGINDEVDFYNKRYKIIGIMGSEYENTLWDDAVQITINNLPNDYTDKLNKVLTVSSGSDRKLNFRVIFRITQENFDNVKGDIQAKFKSLDIEFKEEEKTIDGSVLWSEIREVVFDSLPILIVSIITIRNISYLWIQNRKYEIAIRKILGGTNNLIQKEIIREVIGIGIVSMLFSLLLQRLLEKYFESTMLEIGLSLQVSYGTFIICSIVTLIIGWISIRKPLNLIIDMKPIEILKDE